MALDNVAPPAIKVAEIEPVLIDATAAAEILSISVRTLGDLTRRGIVPSVTLGHRRLYPLTTLREWAAAGCPTSATNTTT